MEKHCASIIRPASSWSKRSFSTTQLQTRLQVVWQVQPWRFRVPSANVRAIEKMSRVTQVFLTGTLIATIGFLVSLLSDAEGAVFPVFYFLVALFFCAYLLVFAQRHTVACEIGKFIFGFFGTAAALFGIILALMVSLALLAGVFHF